MRNGSPWPTSTSASTSSIATAFPPKLYRRLGCKTTARRRPMKALSRSNSSPSTGQLIQRRHQAISSPCSWTSSSRIRPSIFHATLQGTSDPMQCRWISASLMSSTPPILWPCESTSNSRAASRRGAQSISRQWAVARRSSITLARRPTSVSAQCQTLGTTRPIWQCSHEATAAISWTSERLSVWRQSSYPCGTSTKALPLRKRSTLIASSALPIQRPSGTKSVMLLSSSLLLRR